jgi:hypothetical protein
MDFNKTVDFIIRDLEEAREIIDDLKNYPGVPAIQVEMAKSKCRNAAEVIALLKNMKESEKPEEGRKKKEEGRPENEVKNRSEAEPVKTKFRAAEPKPEAPPVHSFGGQSGNHEPVTGIIADSFEKMPDNINEKLGNLRDENDFSDYYKSQPLSNLSQAIGINDRFLFIRELFSGNSETYSKAIMKIDEAKNLPEAKALILDFAGDRIETEAGQQLLDLVKRKFPADE